MRHHAVEALAQFGHCLATRQFRRAARMIIDYLVWGCTETDVWALNLTTARFLLPRFRYFMVHGGLDARPVGVDRDSWRRSLTAIDVALDNIVHDRAETPEVRDQTDEGLRCLAEYFQYLWT